MKKVNLTKKAKIYLIFLTIFTILTFAGAFYVISNHGEPNAGYACIPMIISFIFSTLYHKELNNIDKKK